MDASYKEEWVKRLRSGDYRQGTGRLCNIDTDSQKSYCCLGVLAEVGIDLGGVVKVSRYDDEAGYIWYDFSGPTGGRYGGTLAVSFTKHVGLVDGATQKLIDMNDGSNGHRRHSFAEIADYIEKNL